jgi:hypothetical protein
MMPRHHHISRGTSHLAGERLLFAEAQEVAMSESDDKSPLRESFLARQRKQERQGEPAVYRYDELPAPFLRQVVQILDMSVGSFEARRRTGVAAYSSLRLDSISPHDIWKAINERVAHDVGVFDLNSQQRFNRDKFAAYLLDSGVSIAQKLTAIEHAFQIVNRLDGLGDGYKREYGVRLSPAEATEQLNYRLQEHDLGYRFVTNQIIRIDSEFAHAEIVEPAIHLLQTAGFSGALDEFKRAHQHFRRGEFQDAVLDANNAFESTMKTICDRLGGTLTGTETASQLIRVMTDQVVPSYLESALLVLPTLRNRSGGHGQGTSPTVVPHHIAAYALHLAASNMLFLVESWQAKGSDT